MRYVMSEEEYNVVDKIMFVSYILDFMEVYQKYQDGEEEDCFLFFEDDDDTDGTIISLKEGMQLIVDAMPDYESYDLTEEEIFHFEHLLNKLGIMNKFKKE